MRTWADVSLDELLAEIDAYAGDDGLGQDNGWYTLEEMAQRYGMNRHRMSRILTELEGAGRVEKAKRAGRRRDGVRYWPEVYRLVEKAN